MLYRGLPNLGNTCYLNSILQCLRYTKEFVYPLKGKTGSNALTMSLLDLMYTGADSSVLETLIRELNKSKEFKLMRQCDAHELFLYLMDKLFEDVKAKNPFEGKFKSTVICNKCGHKSVTEYPFTSVSVQIGTKAVSVEDLLHEFSKLEEIEAPIDCEKCKDRQKSSKSLEVLPSDVVVVHLKRFMGRQKIYTAVNLDEEIKINGNKYRLYSMCNHNGTMFAGHYTATCMKRDGTWSVCNDSVVRPLATIPKSSDRPYLLFYCKI